MTDLEHKQRGGMTLPPSRHRVRWRDRSHSSLLALLCLFNLCFGRIYAESGGTSSGYSEEKVPVKGVAGQSASLPCYIDEHNCGDIYFLTWSKLERDDRWSRIYVYSDDNVNKPLSSLAGRASFSMTKSEAQLVINTLKPSDEALYKCDVTYVAGKCPSLTYVQLQIIAKPTRAYIEHEGDVLPNGHQLNLTEDDLLKLGCTVLGGRPQPSLSWLVVDARGRVRPLRQSNGRDAPVELSLISSSHDGTESTTLVLTKKLTRDDLNSKLECHVKHEAISPNSLDSHVRLDMSVGIRTMEIIGPSTSVREGDVAVIECVAYGSKPAAEIVWRNGSRVIDSHSMKNDEEPNADGITVNTRSKLEIVVGHQDHLNPITCEVANVAMRNPVNKSTEISVLFAPIVVMEPQKGLIVNESTPMVSIYCTYKANPSQLLENETVWYKDGQELDTFESVHFVRNFANYPILTIVNVSRYDTGHYSCSMANQLGSGKSSSAVYLNVLYPPTVSLLVQPTPSAEYMIKEGDNLRVICDIIDGNPRNASRMRWLKNNGETISELDSETTIQKELTWVSITRGLSGNYTCQAISDAGASEPSNEVQIVVNYLPGKSIVRLLNERYPVKGANISLECLVNDPGKPSDKTEYHWESSDGIIFESRSSILTIPNLRLANRGNISCSAVNEVGFGPRGYFELIPYAPPRFIVSLPATIGIDENYRSSSDNGHRPPYSDRPDSFPYDTENGGEQDLRPHSPDTISVFCRVECFPLCSITWYRNNQPIDNSSDEFQITESVLPEDLLANRFPSVVSRLTWNVSRLGQLDRQRDIGIIYSCISTANEVGQSVRANTRFQVEYPPENLRLSSSRVDVIENDTLPEIRCDSDALPSATYRWISHSFLDKFSGVISDTAVLSLNRTVMRDQAGTYTCIASNRHGERRTDLQVNVLYPPTCSIYESRTGKENQDVMLICDVSSANPNTGLEFSWSLNGTHFNKSYIDSITVRDGLKSKIVLSSFDVNLFGQWRCVVSNTVGKSEICQVYVEVPLVVPEWSALSDESVLIISAVIVAIIFAFVLILLCLIFLMRRRRHKNEKEKRENPDGSRSPTPSSSTSRVSSNQNDLLSTKSQASSKKATETERLSSSNSSALGTCSSGEMYENMTFHRKPSNCMSHLNGTASYYHHSHLQHSGLHTASPLPPAYESATTKMTNEFRRTQSARFSSPQPFGKDLDDVLYADIYEDVKSGKIADPRVKPPLPPKPGSEQVAKKPPPKLPPKSTSSKPKSA